MNRLVVEAVVRTPLWLVLRFPVLLKDKSMTCITFRMLMLGLLLAPVLCWSAEPKADEAKAIAEIEKLGGRVTRDEKSPGKPVISVELTGQICSPIFPSEIKAGLANLKGLTRLQSLNLRNNDAVTDAELDNLIGLTELRSLNLSTTLISDAGLARLQRLIQLQSLDLAYNELTDTGLVQLKGLAHLQSLNLKRTKVTDAGLV